MIDVDQVWVTGPWRAEPREVIIEEIPEGTDEIRFRFVDSGLRSRCERAVFLRIYQETT